MRFHNFRRLGGGGRNSAVISQPWVVADPAFVVMKVNLFALKKSTYRSENS